MSDVGKGLIKTRFYSFAAYMFLRKLEGQDEDETYTEELIDLIFDCLETMNVDHPAITENAQLLMSVIASEFLEGDYPRIRKAVINGLEPFAFMVNVNFELTGLSVGDCANILKPLHDYLIDRINQQNEEELV